MNADLLSIERLNVALTMHYKKLKKTEERSIYTIDSKSCMSPDSTLILYKMDDVRNNFDMNNRMVQWVMNQLNTYDTETECVFGIVDNECIYSHVVKASK